MPDAPPPQKIRLNTPMLPLLSMILLMLVIIDSYRGWVILLVAFGGIFTLAFVWAQALARGLQIRREIRLGWAQVGDRLEERFTLSNNSRFPALWVEVLGQTNMPDYWANQVRSVKRKSETRWQIRGVCTRRGLYVLGPTTMKTNDPFGIFTVTLHNPASTTLVVTPPVLPLPPVQVAPGGRAGEGVLRIKSLQEDINSAGVREYMSGDSIRRIHWPTTARQNEIFVRVFERSPAGDWWVILDLDQAVQIGAGENATHEHGIILAASLVDLGMRTGRSVGLAAHGEQLIWHHAHISDEHKWDILRSLALVEPGNISLTVLLGMIRPRANRQASLIIITPAVSGAWLPALLALRRLGVVPTILLLEPESFGSDQRSAAIKQKLTALGITHQDIPKELLEYSGGRTTPKKDWGWRDSATGHLVPAPGRGEFGWRDLG